MLRAKRASIEAEGFTVPGTPSKDSKKSLPNFSMPGGKKFRESSGKSEYYPLDYWFVFFVGFFVSYLIFSSSPSSALTKASGPGHSSQGNTRREDAHYLQEKILSCNVALLKLKRDIKVGNKYSEVKADAASSLKLQPEADDSPPLTDKLQRRIEQFEVSEKMLKEENSKLKAMSKELAEGNRRRGDTLIDAKLCRRCGRLSSANGGGPSNGGAGSVLPPKETKKEKTLFAPLLLPNRKQNDFDLSRWSIWDVPMTELYRHWEWPDAPVGSILHKQWVLGVTHENTVEVKQVIAAALLQLPVKGDKRFTVGDAKKRKIIDVVRFERRVERFYGVYYNLHIKYVPTGEVFGIRLMKPLAKLKIQKVTSLGKERPKLVNVIVSVSNRGKQLKEMIKSLIPIKDSVRLIVVDHTSTDQNPRTMLINSGLPHKTFLWAPKTMKKFSRALMLDYAIRSLDDNEIFFTCDVDMMLPSNLHEIVTLSVQNGSHVYAPEVFILNKGAKKAKANTGSFFGWGYGMIGAYKSDYLKVNGYDIAKFRYGWGSEDIDLINRFVRAGYTIVRPREHKLLHQWHPKLKWREESQCDFKWSGGTYCKTPHDDHADNTTHAHTWNFKISPKSNCDFDLDRDLLMEHAASADVPAGSYEFRMASNTTLATGNGATSLKIHMLAVHAHLVEGTISEEALKNVQKVSSAEFTSNTAVHKFETEKSARVYMWATPCALGDDVETTINVIMKASY